MSENLAATLTETAAERGEKVAVKLDDVEVTYSMLDEASARVAAMLHSRGLEPGDRVGIMLPNVPYFPIVYYGILRAGGVVVPMNVLLKGREVEFYLSDSEASLLFAWHDLDEAAEQGTEAAGTEHILVKPGEFERLMGEQDPTPPERRASPRAPSSLTSTWGRTAGSCPASPTSATARWSSGRCRCSTPSAKPAA
jgi:long-chain acyl-CoA synthetase